MHKVRRLIDTPFVAKSLKCRITRQLQSYLYICSSHRSRVIIYILYSYVVNLHIGHVLAVDGSVKNCVGERV